MPIPASPYHFFTKEGWNFRQRSSIDGGMSKVTISVEEPPDNWCPIIIDANKKVAAEQLTVWLSRNKAAYHLRRQ